MTRGKMTIFMTFDDNGICIAGFALYGDFGSVANSMVFRWFKSIL